MKTLHTSSHYAAYQHPKAGLIVQSARKRGGVQLPTDHPQYADYVEAFATVLDDSEGDALCRALLN